MTEEIKRTYVVPLRRGFFNTPRYKRTNKAVTVLKNFLMKHMKSTDVRIGKHLNEFLWKNGIKNPPGKVKVDVIKTADGIVKAELSGKKYVDFKMKEKVDKNQTFKEKLKDKVTAKDDEKEETKKTTAKKETETKKETVKKEVTSEKKETKETTKKEIKETKEETKKETEAKPETTSEKKTE